MDTATRAYRDGDLGQVVALWNAAGIARPWNDPAKDIAFARRDSHAIVLVAETGRRIVATAMVGEDGHRGWVYYVAVDPQHRDRGLGRLIMDAAERWLVARGVWKMQLLVREENVAVRDFYEHLGYRDTRTICLQKLIGDAAG
ncbi:GNAT family acetyltransferase [Methylobacterium sp. 77]|uniref:GNAT family acetyltransferase n=1 Tax=Methylobacterium sp. 77 TaxID=1101192 RepID=UPI0012DC933B|nr:GNAT family acetyltransferase [Methylobacterium sp. 77]